MFILGLEGSLHCCLGLHFSSLSCLLIFSLTHRSFRWRYTFMLFISSPNVIRIIRYCTLQSPSYPLEVPFLCRFSCSEIGRDRKSTRLNSSHVSISYAVFC